MASLVRILELAVQKHRPLLIVAEDVESGPLAMLIINKHQAGVKVCAIKAPGFEDNRRANLEDLAVALLHATRVLKTLQTTNDDQKRGVEIIENALKAPTFTIVSNAGGDGSMVIGKLLEQNDLQFGFAAAQGKYVDMVKSGIIDPLKVVRTALVDAASVSLLLTTTEVTVVDRHGEKNPFANRMPNMDDMGMGF